MSEWLDYLNHLAGKEKMPLLGDGTRVDVGTIRTNLGCPSSEHVLLF
jgi:hypothetical protein